MRRLHRTAIIGAAAAALFFAATGGQAADPAGPPGQQFCNGAATVPAHTTVWANCGYNYWHTLTVSTPYQPVYCSGPNGGISAGFLQGPINHRCSPAQNWVITADLNEYNRPLVSNDMSFSVYFVWQAAT